MYLLYVFMNAYAQLQIHNKNFRFLQMFLTYLAICLYLHIVVHFWIHVIAFKLFGRENCNRKRKNIKAVNYIVLILYVLLTSMLLYTTIVVLIRNQLNTDWSINSILNLSSLFIGTSVLYGKYISHYLKHFTEDANESN